MNFRIFKVATALVVTAFIFSSAVYADVHNKAITTSYLSSRECRRILSDDESLTILKALELAPTLKTYIAEMLQDSNVPNSFRLLLKKSLIENKTLVVTLTDETREQLRIEPGVNGFTAFKSTARAGWVYPQTDDAEELLSQSLVETRPDYDQVFVSDRLTSRTDNDLSTLIHELAHVRFQAYLEKNYDKICQRLPNRYVMHSDSQCLISSQLQNLMHEKYAYETQVKILKLNGFYYLGETGTDMASRFRAYQYPDSHLSYFIGRSLLAKKLYNYTDPQVIEIGTLPLSELLQGGLAMREVSDALDIYFHDETGVPLAADVAVAVRILRFIRAREHQPVSAAPAFMYVQKSITRLLRQDDGKDRLKKIYERFGAYVANDLRGRKALAEIFH
jgi:hypothetical protein